jgi:hypothetical protein
LIAMMALSRLIQRQSNPISSAWQQPGSTTCHNDCHLRARCERPRRRRAAEQRDELAPLHSITSSARASTVAGTSRPSALAVLRLIGSSYLVGACTGRSVLLALELRST